MQTTHNMTIDEYSIAHRKMINDYADKAIANYNEFNEKNDERLKITIELAMSQLLLENRILQSKPIITE